MNTAHPNVIDQSQPTLVPRCESRPYVRLDMSLFLVEAV